MQSFYGSFIRRQTLDGSNISIFKSIGDYLAGSVSKSHGLSSLTSHSSVANEISASKNHIFRSFYHYASGLMVTLEKLGSRSEFNGNSRWATMGPSLPVRSMTTVGDSINSTPQNSSEPITDVAPRIKFKRLDKTARNIMQILDKEAVEEVRGQREIPDVKPGYIVELKVEVPENKRRLTVVKGVVIARRNAGLNTTFRIRRQVAGVGVESLFPLYSPNIKEIKVLDKKKVRRAKLYYLREKMHALKK